MTWIFWIVTLASWWLWGGDAVAIAALAVAWFALLRCGDAVAWADMAHERAARLERGCGVGVREFTHVVLPVAIGLSVYLYGYVAQDRIAGAMFVAWLAWAVTGLHYCELSDRIEKLERRLAERDEGDDAD